MRGHYVGECSSVSCVCDTCVSKVFVMVDYYYICINGSHTDKTY